MNSGVIQSGLSGIECLHGDDPVVLGTQFHSNISVKSQTVFYPSSIEEVVSVVQYCEERNLSYAAYGAGHHISGAGLSVPEIGLCLNKMKGVRIDPIAQTATVSPGATWAEFDSAASKHGLATTGGIVSHTGVFGLTLGGGFGWLMGEYGFACDNVVAAKLVSANGKVKSVDCDHHTDLLWALRGCGTEFGVVVELKFQLHPVLDVLAGSYIFEMQGTPNEYVAEIVSNAVNTAPDHLTVSPQFLFKNGRPMLSVDVCATRTCEKTRCILGQLDEVAKSKTLQKRRYASWQHELDNPKRRLARSHWESAFANSLTPEMLTRAGSAFVDAPSDMWLCSFDHIHGKAADVRQLGTSCCPHREKGVCLLINANWKNLVDDGENYRFASSMFDELSSDYEKKKYVNYVKRVERDQAEINYTSNDLRRLRSIKQEHHPSGCVVLQDIF